ncbi:hypothetical protein HDV05_005226 [Chytridiales sp. JEL 0842]|nr:hypothetical protein HDV05_005226 [Chytridiales sp. JEL 0842]
MNLNHLLALALTASTSFVSSAPITQGSAHQCAGALQRIGAFETGQFGLGASEIVSYDSKRKRMLNTNAVAKAVEIIDISTPSNPILLSKFTANFPNSNAINSVDVYGDYAAVAVEGVQKTDAGHVEFWKLEENGTATFVKSIEICAQPDNVVWSPNGQWVLLPCEGEPNDDYSVDPEGYIAVIDVSNGIESATYRAADFKAFNAPNTPAGLRISSKATSAAADIEPEYIAFSYDSTTAYVSLQENNAIAVIDVASAKITAIYPMGLKDNSLPDNALDVSDEDGGINIKTWNNVVSMYMPDTIAYFEPKPKTSAGVPCKPKNNTKPKGYIITANEGDGREYKAFKDEERVSKLQLDPTVFTPADIKSLGRLSVSTEDGYTVTNGTKVFQKLHVFGGRSFSILDASTGNMVYDSGSLIEKIVAEQYPTAFNSGHDKSNSFDSRSSKKGPEVEVLTTGESLSGVPLLFVGLERMSGVMMFDISNVMEPQFVSYVNPRNFTEPIIEKQGDLGPEGFKFVKAENSASGKPLLLVGNEVSGTSTVYEISCCLTTPQLPQTTRTFSRSANFFDLPDCASRCRSTSSFMIIAPSSTDRSQLQCKCVTGADNNEGAAWRNAVNPTLTTCGAISVENQTCASDDEHAEYHDDDDDDYGSAADEYGIPPITSGGVGHGGKIEIITTTTTVESEPTLPPPPPPPAPSTTTTTTTTTVGSSATSTTSRVLTTTSTSSSTSTGASRSTTVNPNGIPPISTPPPTPGEPPSTSGSDPSSSPPLPPPPPHGTAAGSTAAGPGSPGTIVNPSLPLTPLQIGSIAGGSLLFIGLTAFVAGLLITRHRRLSKSSRDSNPFLLSSTPLPTSPSSSSSPFGSSGGGSMYQKSLASSSRPGSIISYRRDSNTPFLSPPSVGSGPLSARSIDHLPTPQFYSPSSGSATTTTGAAAAGGGAGGLAYHSPLPLSSSSQFEAYPTLSIPPSTYDLLNAGAPPSALLGGLLTPLTPPAPTLTTTRRGSWSTLDRRETMKSVGLEYMRMEEPMGDYEELMMDEEEEEEEVIEDLEDEEVVEDLEMD